MYTTPTVQGSLQVVISGSSGGINSVYGYPTVAPLTTTTMSIAPMTGAGKLAQSQLNQLMASHTFIPLDSSDHCLFCYALDMWRTRSQHDFVISEE